MDVNQLMENVTFVAVHPDRISCYTEPVPPATNRLDGVSGRTAICSIL